MRKILFALIVTLWASSAFGQGAGPSPTYWRFNDSILQATGWHQNPPSSWIGDPDHTRLQILNWDENVVDTTVIDFLGDTAAVFPDVTTWLDLKIPVGHRVTAADSNTVLHPSIVYFSHKWNGYRYWLFGSPLATAQFENPCVWVGNDPSQFHIFIDSVPGSQTFGDSTFNPIDSCIDPFGYNSDPYGFYDEATDKLWCIWRLYKAPSYAWDTDSLLFYVGAPWDSVFSWPESTIIKGSYTYDGAHWSTPVRLLELESGWLIDSLGQSDDGTREDTIRAVGIQCISPSIEVIDGQYRMWAVSSFNFFSYVTGALVTFAPRSSYLFTADNMEGPWDTAGTVTVEASEANYVPWHSEVTKAPDSSLWMVLLESYGGAYHLCLERSVDSGQTFTLVNSHLTDDDPTNWTSAVYKASVFFNDYYLFPGKGLYTMLGLYFSTPSTPRIAYTEALLPLVYDTSGGTGGGSSDSLGIDTDANGTIDQWLYGGSGVIGMIRAGANITLSVSGETLYVAGPAGSGTADSVGVDTSGNGTVDCYLYSTSGAAAVIKEGSGITLTVSADSMTITLNAGPIINDSLDARLAAYPDTAATVDTIQGVLANLNYITASGVTYENLSANSDIGTGATQVAQGNHAHTGVYQPKDATLDTLSVGHIREDLTITGDYTLNATGNIILNQNASDATTMSYLYAYYYTTEMLSSYLRFNPATMRWSILDTLSVPALWVASQKIDNDTGLVSEGELEDSLDRYFDTAAVVDTIQGLMGTYVTDAILEDSLDNYSNTTATQGLINDSIAAHTIPTSKTYFDTTTAYATDSLIVIFSDLADSAKKIDTNYAPLLSFVNNHGGAGTGTADSLTIWAGANYSIMGNWLKLYFRNGFTATAGDSASAVDTISVRADTSVLATVNRLNDSVAGKAELTNVHDTADVVRGEMTDTIAANAYAVDWDYFLVVSDSLTVIKADSAVKALQDASGNTITSYYAAKSGATYTGTHDFTGATLSIPNDAVTDEDIDWTDVTLADFTEQTAWQVFYSNGTGDVTELALGADGTYLKSNGAAEIPSWATPGGSGDVSKVGTPVDNQVGVWTGDGTLEGDADLTFDGTNLSIAGTLDGVDLSAFNAGVSDDTATWKTLTTGFETDSIGADTLIANTVFKYPGGFIDNDTGVVTEGELVSSLSPYQLTASDIDPDRLTGDATDNDRVDSAVCAPVVHKAERDASGNVITTTYAPITPDSTEIDSANIREWVADKIGGMVTGNTETGITVSYEDADNTLDFVVTGGSAYPWTDSTGFLVGWGGVAKSEVNDTNYFRFEGSADFDTTSGVVSLAANSVSATELDETGVESGLEGVLDVADLQGDFDPDRLTGDATDNDRLDSAVCAPIVHKAERDASGNVITTTYAPILPDTTEIDTASVHEWLADRVGEMVTGNTETNITVSYDDADNTLDFVVTGGSGGSSDSLTIWAGADYSTINNWLKLYFRNGFTVTVGDSAGVVDTISVRADTTLLATIGKAQDIAHDTADVVRGEMTDTIAANAYAVDWNYFDVVLDSLVVKLATHATHADSATAIDTTGVALNAFVAKYPDTAEVVDTIQGIIAAGGYVNSTDFGKVTDDTTNWNTAYGWGDWSSEGFITAAAASALIGDSLTELWAALGKVTDDSTALLAAKDSVAAWDNGNLDSANMKTDGIATSDINWKYEYVDLTIPSGRGITADSTAMIPFWRGFLFRDSTWFTTGSDVDTCWVSGSVKDSCTIDSLIFVYRSDGTGVIDKVNLYGPDLSNAINGTDSAYYETDVNLTATSLTRVAYYINETGVKAGYRFKIEFVNTLANDNDYIDVQWVQLCIKR